jgi:tetratricopeptide (TPR) repeat protein
MFPRILFVLCCALFLSRCSKTVRKDELTPEAAKTITLVREDLKNKNFDSAKNRIQNLQDDLLSERDKAEKYNLWGIVHFQQSQFPQAKHRFSQALSFESSDAILNGQIMLNIASCDFKLGSNAEVLERIKNIVLEPLSQNDQQKIYLLGYSAANELKDTFLQYRYLVLLNTKFMSEDEIISSKWIKPLQNVGSGLSDDKKLSVLSEFKDKNYYVVKREIQGLIAFFEKEGDLKKVDELKKWAGMTTESATEKEVQSLVNEELEKLKVGVIIPMSGEKSQYGQMVLKGIALANELIGKNIQFVLRDSQDSAIVARKNAIELIFFPQQQQVNTKNAN